MATQTESRAQRFVLLDGLRGLAAFLVIVFHAERDGSPYYKLDSLFLMVDFFFVLSGFVLLPSLPQSFRKYPRALLAFIVRRIFRLWPVAVVSLVFAYYSYHWMLNDSVKRNLGWDVDPNLTQHNYIMAGLLLQIVLYKTMFTNVPLWSLSSEWLGNLFYSVTTPMKRVIGISLSIALGYKLLSYGLDKDYQWIGWIGPIRRHEAFGRVLIGFGFGLLARIAYDKYRVRINLHGIRAGLLFVVMFIATGAFVNQYRMHGYEIIYFAGPVFALLIFTAAFINLSARKPIGWVMTRMGAWSYAVYAFHRNVLDVFNYQASHTKAWWHVPIATIANKTYLHYITFKIVVVTVICVLLAIAVNWLVERPIQYVGRKLVRAIEGPRTQDMV